MSATPKTADKGWVTFSCLVTQQTPSFGLISQTLCSCSSLDLGKLQRRVCAHSHWEPFLAEAVYLLYPQRSKARQLSLHQLMGNTQLLHC